MSDTKTPSQVLIIRHGEKLGSDQDGTGGVDLSPRGSARAMALPSLFVPVQPQAACALAVIGSTELSGTYSSVNVQGSGPRFLQPGYVFATEASSNSNRPIETVSPLLAALVPTPVFNGSYSDGAYGQLADAILQSGTYANAVVLICWHHGNIPNLATSLGIKKPPHWPGSVFDRVWQLIYSNGIPTLQDLPQQLLYGDSST
jgi:hypothetical protein